MDFIHTLHSEAKKAVKLLLDIGIKVIMLTDDSSSTAKAIGNQAGVDEVYAELLPEQKVDLIRKLKQQYGTVAMVGDGVNDAPALAIFTVGIAMGDAGTEVALETANVVLMAEDIKKFQMIFFRKKSQPSSQTKYIFAIAVILVLVTGNFLADINLPSGVIGHEGSTLIVILSDLRLLH